MGIEVGVLGLLVLILDIYAIIKTVGSGASVAAKVLRVVAILIFPVIGFIAWLLMGPRS